MHEEEKAKLGINIKASEDRAGYNKAYYKLNKADILRKLARRREKEKASRQRKKAKENAEPIVISFRPGEQ